MCTASLNIATCDVDFKNEKKKYCKQNETDISTCNGEQNELRQAVQALGQKKITFTKETREKD